MNFKQFVVGTTQYINKKRFQTNIKEKIECQDISFPKGNPKMNFIKTQIHEKVISHIFCKAVKAVTSALIKEPTSQR